MIFAFLLNLGTTLGAVGGQRANTMQCAGLLPLCRYIFLSDQATLGSIHCLYKTFFHKGMGADEA